MKTTLMQLSLHDGLLENRHGNHSLVVGIDVRCVQQCPPSKICSAQAAHCSIWLYQTVALYHNPRHVSSGANPEMRTLFYKFAHLLNSCIVPMFVFDGPARPPVKRSRLVRPGAHWLTDDLRELIDAFGFYSHQVSGLCFSLLDKQSLAICTVPWRGRSRARSTELHWGHRCHTDR
jgi:hypothetical protein